MLTSRIAVAAALGTLVAAGCSAAAQPPPRATTTTWSHATSLSTEINVNWRPSLAYTGDGHAVAALDGRWEQQQTSVLAAEPGSSTFRKIGEALLLAPPAPYGDDGVAYLRTPANASASTADPIDYAVQTQLDVSLGGVPGSLGEVQHLARFRGAPRDVHAAIAGNPRGEVAAAWVQPSGKRFVLQLALRAGGQTFGAPQRLAYGRNLGEVALAYGAGGDLVVAFDRGRGRSGIAVVVMRPGSAPGPVQPLGRSLGSSSLAAAVSPEGRAVVAWGTQDAWSDHSEVDGPWSVRAALLAPHARRFAATQLVDPGRAVAFTVAGVSAVVGADGTATVAWSGLGAKGTRPLPYGGGRPYPIPVRVATAVPGRRFGRSEQLARNGAALGLVTARDGTTTVLWGLFAKPEEVDDYVESLDRMYTSRRAPGARHFARAIALSPREPIVNAGSIALDPSSERPAALWIEAVGGELEVGLYDFPHVEALFARGPASG